MKTLEDKAFAIFEPKVKESVTDWAEKNVFLSERITEQAGLYRTSSHPYVKEILENFANSKVKKISLCWGSQTGKTTTIYVGVGYAIDQQPCPILWVWSNEKQARAFANDRFLPFCEDSKSLRKHLPKTSEGKIDRDRATALRVEFDRCSLNMVGGGSHSNVRNFPVSMLVMDEIDIIPEPIRLEALARVKGRRSYKVIQSSTPLGESTGIWSEYKTGDQRKYFMPCPYCKKPITFDWKKSPSVYNIHFPPEAKKENGSWDLNLLENNVFYKCQECEGLISDAQKIRMLRQGEWRPTNENAEKGVRSYHLNSLYSPTLTFSQIMIKWIQSIETVDGLKQFVTGWLAEPWRDENLSVAEEATHLLSADYKRGEHKGEFRLMGIDVQRTHFVWLVRGFDSDGTSYLIDHGYAPSWSDLDSAFVKYDCSAAIIDAGYGNRTQEVYEGVYQRRAKFWACKGWSGNVQPYTVKTVDPFTGTGKAGKHRIRHLHINVEVWGGELLKRRAKKIDGWNIYEDPDREYIKQLNSKFLIEKTDNKGNTKLEWRTRRHGQDHYWDCELYLLCLSKVVGLGNITKKNEEQSKTENTKRAGKRSNSQRHKASKGSSIW